VHSTGRRIIAAFLASDESSATALLAPDATFHSPIRDYRGADRIGAVWRAVAHVVADGHATSVHEQDDEAIVFFAGTINDEPVDGVLRALTNDENRVSDLTLMIRPWAALKAGIADIKT
jgi:hypothetical protein